ncbi:MAG: long-chain fatty acid--CoA ligase, partial [Legionella sp.]
MWFLNDSKTSESALQLGEQILSYQELAQQINSAAKQLKQLPKALLILTATWDWDFIIQFFAALSIEQPIALFSANWSEQEQQEKIALLGSWMRITSKNELSAHQVQEKVRYHPELALILFTSGSTGQVKAVQLSQKNILANCQAVIHALDFKKVTSQLLFLPLSYSFGLLGQLIPGLMTGIHTVLLPQFTDIKMHFETGNIPQMWSGVPSHWVAIQRMASVYPESAAKIKAIVSAGAPLAIALRKDLQQHFPNAVLYNNYGLTEASPRVLTYSSEDPLFWDDYAGYPVGDWQVKLSADEELLIQGKQMMLGYLGDTESPKIQAGWLATGDIAEILPTGLVAIKGRRDNQVNIAGEKVQLAEIEQKLRLVKEIKEVLVLATEDSIYGARLFVCIEQNPTLSAISAPEMTTKI